MIPARTAYRRGVSQALHRPHHDQVTELLAGWAGGDLVARDAAMGLLYGDLHRMARKRMRTERDVVTMQATGLVHEVYLRMAAQQRTCWRSRGHFFAVAARIMRRVLIEAYRARRAQKRGNPDARVAIDDVDLVACSPALDLENLNAALDRLEEQDGEQARLVELRYFAGLTIEECAEAMGWSPATVKREWAVARAWLKREMSGEE
jgi:RNA polymerase sigma factor (TIGR02999 family)